MADKQVSTEEIREAAYSSCMQLFLTLRDRNCSVVTDDVALIDEVVRETVLHHRDHLKVHQVEQKHVDGYKLVSWLGCILLKKLVQTSESVGVEPGEGHFKVVSGALVDLLAGFLFEDKGVRLPDEMLNFLENMLYEEAHHNSDHGIWMNGLYAAFHAAVVALEAVPEDAASR